MTVYCLDMDDYRAHSPRIGQMWRRLVGSRLSGHGRVGVARLWDAEALVEVQGIAVVHA